MSAWVEARTRGATGPELDRAFHVDVADFADLLPETGPMPQPRVVMRDPTLPHQIKLDYRRVHRNVRTIVVVVGCNCGRLHRVITDADRALIAYRNHLTREGVDPNESHSTDQP